MTASCVLKLLRAPTRLLLQIALLAALPCSVLASSTAWAQANVIGSVSEVQGEAMALRAGGRSRVLDKKAPVLFRDTLKTADKSRLVAVLDDDTKLTLGDNASVVVDTFVYDPRGTIGRLSARFRGGAFLFVGGSIEDQPGARVQVRTPLATLGIRGTTVWGGPIDGAYGVLVVSGRVDVRTPRGTVTLRDGQGTTLRPRRSPEPVVTWGADKVRRALESVAISR